MLAALDHDAADGDKGAQEQPNMARSYDQRCAHVMVTVIIVAILLVIVELFDGKPHFFATAGPSGRWPGVELVENLGFGLLGLRDDLFVLLLGEKGIDHAAFRLDIKLAESRQPSVWRTEESVAVVTVRSVVYLRAAGVWGAFKGVSVVFLLDVCLLDQLLRVKAGCYTDVSVGERGVGAPLFRVYQTQSVRKVKLVPVRICDL